MENKTAKTRITLGGGAFESPLNSLFGQKISVHDENFNQKSKKPFKNLAVMLNLFQHLTGKRRLKKDLCLLPSNRDGQMLKQHARGFLTLTLKASWLHTCLEIQALRKSVVLLRMGVLRPPDFRCLVRLELKLLPTISVTSVCACLMLGCVVLRDNDDKQLNKLKIKASKKAKKQASCRTRFGIYPENECREGYSLFFNRKIFNKFVSSLRCLFVRCRNKFGMTPNISGVKACTAYGKCQSGRVQFIAPQSLTPQGLAQC